MTLVCDWALLVCPMIESTHDSSEMEDFVALFHFNFLVLIRKRVYHVNIYFNPERIPRTFSVR